MISLEEKVAWRSWGLVQALADLSKDLPPEKIVKYLVEAVDEYQQELAEATVA